jgi:hypothetical protein
MNVSQINRFSRDERSESTLESGEIVPLLQLIPGYSQRKVLLSTHMARVRTLRQQQFSISRGLTAVKNTRQAELIPFCLKLSVAGVAYGKNTKDAAFVKKAAIKKSKLEKLSFTKLIVFAQDLFDLGFPVSTDLVAYHITGTFFDDMQEAIHALEAAKLAANKAMDQQKQITAEIDQLLKLIDEDLAEIIIMVETLRDSQPVFCEVFSNATRINDVAGTTLSLVGSILDAATGEVIPKCRVRISGFTPLEEPATDEENTAASKKKSASGGTEFTKSVKFASANGMFRYKNLPSGTYELAVYMAGYLGQKVTFYVNTGLSTEISIRLQKTVVTAA